MITLCIPTLSRFDTLEKCIQSALDGTVKPHFIHVMDNSAGACPVFTSTDCPILVERADFNLGCAASWNIFMKKHDFAIICNDDITFHKTGIEEIVNAIEDGHEFVAAGGANAFSCFYLSKRLYHEVGEFDEAFYPAYFEDNDYAYRMKMRGHSLYFLPTTVYDHVGSATLKNYGPLELDQHHRRFRKNQDYYKTKWGGLPHEETYVSAFNI